MADPTNTPDPSETILAPGETGPWEWWAGDGESYGVGPHLTREDAIDEGKDAYPEHFTVIEARQKSIDLAQFMTARDVELWVDNINDRMADGEGYTNEDGDSPLDCVTDAQWADLAGRLAATVRDWQRAQGLELIQWSFAETRNETSVDIAADGTVTATTFAAGKAAP